MKYTTRKFISLFLCFIVFFQPIIFKCSLYADNAIMFQDENGNQVDSSYINSEIERNGSEIDNQKSNGRVSSYIEEEEAKAKANDSEMKNISTDNVGSNNTTINNKMSETDNRSIGALTEKTGGIQSFLIKTGQILQKIGSICKKVGYALMAIGAALSAFIFTAAIGALLIKVGKILCKVGSAIEAVGKVVESTGNLAKGSDASFGSIISGIGDAAKSGWKKGGEEADAYSNEMTSKFSNSFGSFSQENSSVTTANTESDITSDADQSGVADF